MKTKAQAEKAAQELIAKMKTPGWTWQVWENLGWHYNIRKGPFQVYPSGGEPPTGHYGCLMADHPNGGAGGLSMWTPRHNWDEDPNVAVEIALKAAEEVVGELLEAVLAGREAAGKPRYTTIGSVRLRPPHMAVTP